MRSHAVADLAEAWPSVADQVLDFDEVQPPGREAAPSILYKMGLHSKNE